MIQEEIEVMPPAKRDANYITTAFVIATNKYMKVTSGQKAMELLTKSTRIAEDLSKLTHFGKNDFDTHLVIREWLDDVPYRCGYEFRGFVHKKSLNALSQYFSFLYFKDLVDSKKEVEKRILDFYNNIKGALPHESFVIDFLVLKDRVLVIELNPFHSGAGAGLFSWKHDREKFLNGPFEFRVTTEPEKDVEGNIPAQWLKKINAKYLPEKLKKKQADESLCIIS